MSKEELSYKMREVLRGRKSPEEVDRVVEFMLNQPSLQTDLTRLIFFEQWKDKL